MDVQAWFVAHFDGDPKSVLANGPELDRDASRALAERLCPGLALHEEAMENSTTSIPIKGRSSSGATAA